MFLRWQSRARRSPEFGPQRWDGDERIGELHWRGILVESVRVDGKPRQKHVAYLISFTESRAQHPSQRCWIWQAVTQGLDALGDRLTADDRRRIEAAINAKVERPTKAEHAAALKRAAQAAKALGMLRG